MKLLMLALMLISVDITASSTFEPGDKKYVWAKNGLNIRSGPGTSYDILDKITFGDSIELVLATDLAYNISALPKVDTSHYRYNIEKIQPFIMNGYWMKIITRKGIIGYTISQYLLDIKPTATQDLLNVPLQIMSVDTLLKRNEFGGGESPDLIVQYSYAKGIINKVERGIAYSSTVQFPNMTFAEVLVVMGLEGSFLKIMRNWKEELVLSDGGMTYIRITLGDDRVVYKIVYSC